MRIVALKPLPQGQPTGWVGEMPDAAGDLFIRIGAARLAADEDASTVPAGDGARRRRAYRRRDLQAADA